MKYAPESSASLLNRRSVGLFFCFFLICRDRNDHMETSLNMSNEATQKVVQEVFEHWLPDVPGG